MEHFIECQCKRVNRGVSTGSQYRRQHRVQYRVSRGSVRGQQRSQWGVSRGSVEGSVRGQQGDQQGASMGVSKVSADQSQCFVETPENLAMYTWKLSKRCPHHVCVVIKGKKLTSTIRVLCYTTFRCNEKHMNLHTQFLYWYKVSSSITHLECW